MSFLHKILNILLLLPLVVAAACSNNDPDVPDSPPEQEVAGYLQLAVSTSGSSANSRSNPSGGENGDGLEHGRNNENKIYNLSIFVYRDLGEGLDGDYSFVWTRDVDEQTILESNPDLPYDHIYTVKIPLLKDDIGKLRLSSIYTLRAVVVANSYNNLSELYSTTSDLRTSRAYGDAWRGSPAANADYFVMSSAFNGAKNSNRDGRVAVTGQNTTDATIFSCQVSLERVAARLDFQVTNENIGDSSNGLLYNVINTNHRVRLTNIIPVNLMKTNSYLIKHVSTNAGTVDELKSDKWLAAGDETISGGIPTNYVVSPGFFMKPGEEITHEYSNPAAELRKKSDGELSALGRLSPEFLATAYRFDGAAENERTIVLTYANENTCHKTVQEIHEADGTKYLPSDYLTGLLFRAKYYPGKVYTTGATGDGALSAEYVEGNDFWLFRRLAVEGVSEAGNLYFQTEEALNAYVAANTAALEEGIDYRTAKYTGGVCYYNVWLKHANINTDDNIPMMYGIVRNNIYRLQVSFSNIGLPTPEIEEPHRLIDFVIDVVPWVFGGKVHIPMES